MNREQALNYMRSSGWSEEQINTVTEALTCEDAISRQAVLEQINCWIGSGEYRYANATYYLNKRITSLSSVNTEKTGRWILTDKEEEIYCHVAICSVCGRESINEGADDYCSCCGAKMEVDV